MAASGFGRDAGPLNRAPGAAPLAFGAGAGAAATPPSAAPPVPVQFPSARPVAPFVRPSPNFPSARPQLPAAASSARPRAATAPVPIPLSSARPAPTAPGAPASVRFPSPVRALNPGAAAATARHTARHIQPQPRLAALSVGRPTHTVTSSRSRSPPHLPNQRLDLATENDNGMGQRRLINYADPLFDNGSAQPSTQMRMQPPEIEKTARSPPSDMTRQFRPSSSFQNYPPYQRAEPRDPVQKPNLSPSKLGIQNRSPFQDARGASSPLLNSNLVPGSGMPRPALGTTPSSHYDNSTQPVMAQQEMIDHTRNQRFSAPFQSRTVDQNISKRSRSPTLSYQDVDGAEARHGTGANASRLIDYTDTLVDHASVETSKRMKAPSSEFRNTLKSPSSDIRDNIRSAAAGFGSNGAAQNLRSQADIQRPNASIPKVGGQIQSRIGDVHSPPYQMFRPSDTYPNEHGTPAFSPPKPSILSSSRRSVTPPLDLSDDAIPSTELEREKQAKAKRLARFNVELSRPVENINDFAKADKQKQTHPVGKAPDRSNDSTLADMDSPELAAILGLCSDMCPEPERAERERKGDLDRYERLGGDRNQTTELLAVKKYTRTAERDADLIRPLPVLQKTMSYLLSLLDHTYDDSFLGLYNFLWDRMRAIRMDLRMQHFFNQESISMLEQMIRLHIVAMHELCEYSKGEGFSEGFDAHLNIEQMNKTSVELFQMYDDHRRKGVLFSTEKEFRGYYALLKLDKHPGYKVEPSELSLDLAKMSHEIRGSPDILFAREVARVCRMGNYIAFFRLARKATYLQACLMHAHFGKVRRQALASLHSGLQIGQGIPISHVVEWLAMEDEDIESLLEYHGFGSRQYDEPYLVKEGPFLNSETDFRSGCSELVHLKKSQRIVDDVSSGPVCAPTSQKVTLAPYSGLFASPASKRELVPPQAALVIPVNAKREFGLSFSGPASPTSGGQITSPHSHLFSPNAGNKQSNSPYSGPISPTSGRKESVLAFPSTTSPRATKRLHTGWMDDQRVASPKAKGKTKVPDDLITSEDHDGGFVEFSREQTGVPQSASYTQHIDALAEAGVSHPLADCISSDYPEIRGVIDDLRGHGSGSDADLDEEGTSYREVNLIEPVLPTGSSFLDYEYGDQQINDMATDDLLPIVASPKNKISDARLTMILRKWRQRAVDRRSLREQKNALAIAALNSLSLGPPVHQTAVVPKHPVDELDIGHALKERETQRQRSWSRLNVSELAGPILIGRKPDAGCICWKMLVLVPPGAMESQNNNVASKWLLEKLMGSGNGDNGLLFTSADLSIWRTWMGSPSACCLSVVRASDQHVIANGIADSTNSIVFVVSESISWEMQKERLRSLLASIPPQSSLPLLILSGDTYNGGYDYVAQNIIDKLGASVPSEGKIASSLVVFLVGSGTEGNANDFLDDDKLREGLKWMVNSLPLQPDVILVKTRELLLNYLNPSLEMLNRRAAPEVGPEHCISVFNDAANQLEEEILAAVYRTPIPWPAREIDLLERSSGQRKFTEKFLPSIGWSLPSRIQPLVEIIKRCKLPEFSDDLSWLKQGCYKGQQIQDQKLFLEDCLTKYLTQSTRLFNGAQAVVEAKVMVQKGVGLKVRDSYHYLVTNWVTIFRRICNWRLASLSTGEFSEAYVLSQRLYQAESNGATQHGLTANSEIADEDSSLEDHDMLPVMPSGLSLDEMIEVSCDPASFNERLVGPLQPRLPTPVHEEPQVPAHINGEVINPVHRATHDDDMHDIPPRRLGLRDLVPPGWDDALVKLEQQCAEVQSKIADELYIWGHGRETSDIVE